MLRDRERVRALLLGKSSPHRICARCGPCRIRSGHDSGNEGPGPCKKLGEIHYPDCPGKLALAAKQDQARVSHHLESPGEVGSPFFRQALNETGYAEGRNLAIDYNFADGHYTRLRY